MKHWVFFIQLLFVFEEHMLLDRKKLSIIFDIRQAKSDKLITRSMVLRKLIYSLFPKIFENLKVIITNFVFDNLVVNLACTTIRNKISRSEEHTSELQ